MSPPLRLAPAYALETAIELTKRFGDAAGAELLAIDASPNETTVRLAIPASGSDGVRALRRRLWISFVDRSVAKRRGFEHQVFERVGQRRDGLRRSRERAELVRRFIVAHDAR